MRKSSVLTKLEKQATATRKGLVGLLTSAEGEAQLFASADKVRVTQVGEDVHLRALIEFSNHCWRNCRYCGLRRQHQELARYRMTPEDIVGTAGEAVGLGYRTIVLQSGEDPYYTADLLSEVVRKIKKKHEVAVTLSIGERPEEDYRELREAGADRFLLRIETSSPDLYRELQPDLDWESRVECLGALRRLDYQVGSGVMIGLPGQTPEMLADDLLFLQSLDLDMIGVGPFLPHPATPLAEADGGTLELALRFVACLRLLVPQALIPATTALEALHPEGRRRALQAGANVMMPNCTPTRYREMYQLYPGKISTGEAAPACRTKAEEMVAELGRRVGTDYGHSLRIAGEPAEAPHDGEDAN